jgi:hypothetical protein
MTPIEFKQSVREIWREICKVPNPPKDASEWALRLDQIITDYCCTLEDLLDAADTEDWK